MTDVWVVLVVLLVLALIWRGQKTLPQIGRSLGTGLKNVRREAANIRGEHKPPPNDDVPR